jgi:hypothetical protein
MIVTAGLLVTGMGSLALVILELCKAPQGYEDERGFHAVRKGAMGTVSLPRRFLAACTGIVDGIGAFVPLSGNQKRFWRDPVMRVWHG